MLVVVGTQRRGGEFSPQEGLVECSKTEVVGISIGEGRGKKDWQKETFSFLCVDPASLVLRKPG